MSQHDDLFKELGRTLDVSPSRGFADGVRARIGRRRLVVRATMSGLAIAASVLLVVIARWPEPVRVAEVAEVTRMATAPVVVPPPASLALPPAAVTVDPSVPVPQPRRVIPVDVPDRLLVVTNQMAVLEALWAGHRVTAGESEVPAETVVTATEPTPVVVEPVRVLPVVIVDQRVPVEGLPIIRRAVAALETK